TAGIHRPESERSSPVSVTAAKGFVAAGVRAGIKASGNPDLALVQNVGPRQAGAAVFTSNRCQANPILWSKEAIKDGQIAAIVLNSGRATCYPGPFGFQTTHATAERVAERLQVSAGDVLVCSTGLIGVGDQTFRDAVLHGVDLAAEALTADGGPDAAT